MIYPEGEYALRRAAGNPQHIFFKRYGAAVPARDWNDPGTKQGIYVMGPDAEYLAGGHSISSDAKLVTQHLRLALEQWNRLRVKKKYANKPVPQTGEVIPPEHQGKALVLRVNLRDLPRSKSDPSGRRFTTADKTHPMWMNFTKWAWNENWITFDDPAVFVPKGKQEQAVDADVVLRLCCEVLVDNVRGQTWRWQKGHVTSANLTMQRVKVANDRWSIEYRGAARMVADGLKFEPTIYGRAVWNARRKQFDSLDLVATGMREGAGSFNQRKRDPGPAPMGITLGLHRERTTKGTR